MHSIPSVRITDHLAILTFMTFTPTGGADRPWPWNIVVALLIAFFKMMLVILFFMNVKADSRSPSSLRSRFFG